LSNLENKINNFSPLDKLIILFYNIVMNRPLEYPKEDYESPLDYFFRMLLEEKLNFIDLLERYAFYLEKQEKRNRKLITESAFLLYMYHKPKTHQGTKKQLKDRTVKAINEANIFDDEVR